MHEQRSDISRRTLLRNSALVTGGILLSYTAPAIARAASVQNELYVSPYGSDTNNGSIDSPFRTIRAGIKAATPGNTLYLKPGEYNEHISERVVAAQSDSPIKVEGLIEGEARPVIRGTLRLVNADYWHLTRLAVTWGNYSEDVKHMVNLAGEGWAIRNSQLWDSRGYSALLISGESRNVLVEGCVITNTYPTHGPNQDHLVYVNRATGGIIERNLLVNSENGRAIKLGSLEEAVGADYPSGFDIRYNTMVRNLGPSNVQVSYGARDNWMHGNILVEPKRYNVTAHELMGGNNLVFGNVVWNSKAAVEPNIPGLLDGGGNRMLDPRLDHNFMPQNPDARGYGYLAGR